jgi:cupin 2 domain-containing protein
MSVERKATSGRLQPPESAPSSGERVEVLSEGAGWRIEQILSGHLAAPVEDLLDHVEWVTVVHGAARLDLDGDILELGSGDWVRIGPGLPHRVLSAEPGTTWLAVHVELTDPPSASEPAGPQ